MGMRGGGLGLYLYIGKKGRGRGGGLRCRRGYHLGEGLSRALGRKT